jgi:hypothetical protein
VQRFSIVVVAVILALVGCQATNDLTGPQRVRHPTQLSSSRDVEGYDCELDPTVCQKILAGINYLQREPSGDCEQIGNGLLGIYNDASGYGFKAGDNQRGDMYVLMHQDGTTMSGYSRSDGYVYVNQEWVDDPLSGSAQTTAGLLVNRPGFSGDSVS